MTRNLLLEVLINEIGPSVNHLYFTLPFGHGKRVLTKEGAAFKNALHQQTVEAWKAAGLPAFDPEAKFELEIWCRFPTLYNKKGKLIKLDASNRIKVTEDALMEALGIDDCQNFCVSIHKLEGPAATLLRLFEIPENPTWPT
jgi:hypothetical protein